MSIYDFAQDVRGSRPRQSRLVVDDDFSWSDLPRRRGRAAAAERQADLRRHRDRYDQAERYDHDERYDYGERYDHDERYDSGERYDHNERSAYEERDDPYQSQIPGVEELDLYPDAYEVEDLRGVHLDEQAGAIALAAPGRRTIVITGHGAERNLPVRPRREASLAFHERSGFRPDRIALWAFLLALALLLGATTSSHAAVLAQLAH